MNSESSKIRIAPRPHNWLRSLLMLDDTEHSIALGTAIGIFLGMTPTVGLQTICVMLLSATVRRFFRFNVMAALISIYISNPITIVPIYYGLYKVGTWFVGGSVTREQFAATLEYNSFSEWWDTVVDLFVSLGEPLLVGTAIVAIPCGLVTYPLMRWLLGLFRKTPARSQDESNSQSEEERESLVA
jgi:uncharacterized protein (DUF2062 family)